MDFITNFTFKREEPEPQKIENSQTELELPKASDNPKVSNLFGNVKEENSQKTNACKTEQIEIGESEGPEKQNLEISKSTTAKKETEKPIPLKEPIEKKKEGKSVDVKSIYVNLLVIFFGNHHLSRQYDLKVEINPRNKKPRHFSKLKTFPKIEPSSLTFSKKRITTSMTWKLS